jgi:hypothetical protein
MRPEDWITKSRNEIASWKERGLKNIYRKNRERKISAHAFGVGCVGVLLMGGGGGRVKPLSTIFIYLSHISVFIFNLQVSLLILLPCTLFM